MDCNWVIIKMLLYSCTEHQQQSEQTHKHSKHSCHITRQSPKYIWQLLCGADERKNPLSLAPCYAYCPLYPLSCPPSFNLACSSTFLLYHKHQLLHAPILLVGGIGGPKQHTWVCLLFGNKRDRPGQPYSSEGCSSLGRDVKHVRVFEEGPQQGNEGERRVKDRQKERGTRVVRISFFCPSLSLSLYCTPTAQTGWKEESKVKGRMERVLSVCGKEYWVKSMPTGRVGDNKRQKRKESWKEEWEAEEEGGTLESCKKLQERSRERNERWNSYFQMQFPSSVRWVALLIMEEPACHGGFTDFTVCQ